MNWRASLTAAVIVLAGGVATGAILGASKSKTHTVTSVVQAKGTFSSPGSPTTPTVTAPPVAGSAALTSRPRQVNDIDSTNVTTPGQISLNGTPYQDALVIDNMFQDCGSNNPTAGPAWIAFPVSGLARFKGTLGLNTAGGNTSPDFSMTVEARANSVKGPLLRFSHSYSASNTVANADFQLNGARQLLFVFRGTPEKDCGIGDPSSSEFVFANGTLKR